MSKATTTVTDKAQADSTTAEGDASETHECVCPQCGATKQVPLGQKCNEVRCPECAAMMRQATSGTDEGKTATNALKAISRTDDELRVGNYIVLFHGRDLEGVGSPRANADGSRGEYFTKNTDLESFYTRKGAVIVDWEHRNGELGDEDLGVVDWKTARVDDKGVFAERVLNRRSQYVQWIEELGWFDDGTLGTSSGAVPGEVQKRTDGEIARWPLMRDTITVQPMEPRMMREFGQNHLRAFKGLGLLPAPDDKEAAEQEQETAPEAEASAVAVARAKARLQRIRVSLMEVSK